MGSFLFVKTPFRRMRSGLTLTQKKNRNNSDSSFLFLEFGFPEPVDVAIGVDGAMGDVSELR
jgi:hypothetical protein